MGQEFPAAIQSLYAELLERLFAVPGPYTGITVFKNASRGKDYWYLEYRVGKSKNRLYLGADTPEVSAMVEAFRKNVETRQESEPELKRMVSSLAAAGYHAVSGREYKVFEVLAQAGIFAAGSVVVGSHAFGMIGNMLGIKLPPAIARTQDIDIANDFRIQIGTPDKDRDIQAILKEADQNFIAVPALSLKSPSTSFTVRGASLRVDMLTPMIGKTDSRPRKLKSVNAMAEPVRFLDYLLKNVQPAVVLGGAGVLVHVPNPAHFALHKLVTSQRRPAAMAAKSKKDIEQANLLLEQILESRPGDLYAAFEDAYDMPEKFLVNLRSGIALLSREMQDRLIPEYLKN